MVKLDLHVHSMFSYDSGCRPEWIVKKARRLGLDGVVITEHNSYVSSEEWDHADREGLLILRGAEYNTREGHLLLYGIISDEHIAETHKPLAEIIRIADGEGWALVAPHPFKGAPTDLGKAVYDNPGLHAFELNSYCSDEENRATVKAARDLGLPLTAGSDAHVDSRVGRFHTVFNRPIATMEQLVTELKEGDYRPARLLPDQRGAYCIPEMLL